MEESMTKRFEECVYHDDHHDSTFIKVINERKREKKKLKKNRLSRGERAENCHRMPKTKQKTSTVHLKLIDFRVKESLKKNVCRLPVDSMFSLLTQELPQGSTRPNSCNSHKNILQTPQSKNNHDASKYPAQTPATIFSHWSQQHMAQIPMNNQLSARESLHTPAANIAKSPSSRQTPRYHDGGNKSVRRHLVDSMFSALSHAPKLQKFPHESQPSPLVTSSDNATAQENASEKKLDKRIRKEMTRKAMSSIRYENEPLFLHKIPGTLKNYPVKQLKNCAAWTDVNIRPTKTEILDQSQEPNLVLATLNPETESASQSTASSRPTLLPKKAAQRRAPTKKGVKSLSKKSFNDTRKNSRHETETNTTDIGSTESPGRISDVSDTPRFENGRKS